MWPEEVNDVMPRNAEDLGDLRKAELSSCVRTGRLTFGASWGQTSSLQMGCRTWFGADVKAVSIERLFLSLSTHVE